MVFTLLGSGFIVDNVRTGPRYVLVECRRSDEFGVTTSYVFVLPQGVLPSASARAIARHATPGLRPGDAVAVLATSDRGKPESQTVTLLERAVIYDVSLEPGRIAIGRGSDGGEEGRGLTNVTLVVPKPEAERLAHAVVNWDLTLALLVLDSGSGTSGR